MKNYLPKYFYEIFSNPSIENIIGFIFTIFPWILIIYWIIISIKMVKSPNKYSYYRINSIPSVFVTLGLLGTFLGITFGLIHFDTSPDKIKDSIVVLLSGLKSAFFTSIAGILLSLIFAKINRRLYTDRAVKEPESIEYEVLVQISKTLMSIKQESIKQNTGMEDVKNDIRVQTKIEYEVLTKMSETLTKIEQESANQNVSLVNTRKDIKIQTIATKQMSENIQNFAETLGEHNAQALTAALQTIIEDFNDTFKNFIEQLVDKNFDKLTDSIHQLIKWQTEYKKDISTITKAYESLVDKHKQFADTTQNWVNNLDEITGESSELRNIVRDFKAVFDDNSNFSKLIGQIGNSVANLENTTSSISTISKGVEKTTDAFIYTENKISTWLEREEGIRDSIITFSDALIKLREFDIASIEKLDQSFYDRLGNTFKQLDVLMKKYVQYLESHK